MKATGEVKPYLTLQDICVQSETKVIRGEVLDEKDHTLWVAAENEVVRAGAFIRAGSVIEKAESLARAMVKAGVYVDAGETRHFNLEDVFDRTTVVFAGSDKDGNPGKPSKIADVLRSYGIHSYEQIVENANAFKPMIGGKKGGPIKAQDALRLNAKDEDEFKLWMEQSQNIVNGK